METRPFRGSSAVTCGRINRMGCGGRPKQGGWRENRVKPGKRAERCGELPGAKTERGLQRERGGREAIYMVQSVHRNTINAEDHKISILTQQK